MMSDVERLYHLFLGNHLTHGKCYRIKFHDGKTREGVPWTGSMLDLHDPNPTFFLDSNGGSRAIFFLRDIARLTEINDFTPV